jgi:hypothetical protein
VADDDCICITAHHADGIGKGLPFRHGTGLDTAHREGGAPKARHGGFKGQARAGTGFKKEDGKDLAGKSIFGILLFFDLLCMIQQTIDCAAVKIPDGNDVMRGNSSRREIV